MAEERKTDEALEKAVETDEDIDRYIRELTGKETPKDKEKKPEEKKETKKAELKAALHVQFAGKSYAQDDLMKMAKDVWKYDLKQKAGDLVSVELYVKPEESMVYYVMNKDFTGSFYI